MVTDEELAQCVESLLRQAGPTISASDISVPNLVRHLGEKLGLDLSHKEPFIRHQIAMLLPPSPPPPPPPTQNDRFTPPALFHRFQYHPPNLTPAAAFQNQQEMLMKYQTVQEASHVRSGVSHVTEPSRVADVSEPAREEEKPAVVAATVSKESTPAPAKRRGGPGGLNKMCGVSPELQTIVGEPTMARTQIVKQLWAYIRKNNLQDPNNKRKIICNDELRLLFETDCTDMFKMNKLLAKHIIPLSEPSREAKKMKRESSEVVSFEGTESDKVVMISDALAEFLGTGGERKMLRSEAVDRIWDHIRTNRLEDPRNAMVIICDEKLRQLFGCENVSVMGISELLSRHCFLQSNPCLN